MIESDSSVFYRMQRWYAMHPVTYGVTIAHVYRGRGGLHHALINDLSSVDY